MRPRACGVESLRCIFVISRLDAPSLPPAAHVAARCGTTGASASRVHWLLAAAAIAAGCAEAEHVGGRVRVEPGLAGEGGTGGLRVLAGQRSLWWHPPDRLFGH
eukprot:scaffold3871_cov97-Isochrysis_galbana.AAC.15